jgi:hypothetical protein
MSEQRDKDLGARFDELDVQEHGSGYWEAVMTAAEPELERLQVDAEGRAQAGGVQPTGRPGGHGLAGGRWTWGLATAAVATAIALFLLLGGLPGGDGDGAGVGPPPATAAEAISYALTALDDAQAVRGTIRIGNSQNGSFEEEDVIDFLAARDGSLRTVTRPEKDGAILGPKGVVTTNGYDAPARRTQVLIDFGPKGIPYETSSQDLATGSTTTETSVYRYEWVEQNDVAPAAPDLEVYRYGFPLWQLRAYPHSMLGVSTVRLSVEEMEGQTVWVLHGEALPASSSRATPAPRPITIAIDAATRMPLRYVGWYGLEVRITAQALARAPAPGSFTIEKPPAEETHFSDATMMSAEWSLLTSGQPFQALPFGDQERMAEVTDHLPAFPAWVPAGFAFSAGAYTKPYKTISLCYQRGFDQAFVSVRPDPRRYSATYQGEGPGTPQVRINTSDPFLAIILPSERSHWRARTIDVRLRAGAFAGLTAHVVEDPDHWPHLWVKKGGWVAAVGGNLARAEMVRIAESLRSWNAAGGE